jgi:hypothetical protein
MEGVYYVAQEPDDLDNRGVYYLICRGCNTLGYTWKEEVFTYMGTEGWNRGTRIRDYYPVEWKAGKRLYEHTRLSYKTRKAATRWFVDNECASPE